MISDDLLRALGRITVNFQMLEFWLAMLLWPLLGNDQQSPQITTASLSFNQRVNLLRALAQAKLRDNHELRGWLERVVAQAEKLEQRRNELVHSQWLVMDDGTANRAKTTVRGRGFKQTMEMMSANDLDRLADELREAVPDSEHFDVLLTTTGCNWIERSDNRDGPGPHHGTLTAH